LINKNIPGSARYAAIIEDMSRDYRLTALDWRVMTYLLSRTHDWKVSQADIASRVLSEERAVRQSLLHLEELEYGHRVMRHGGKQSYMIDFVLNYTSPSIPLTRNRNAGSTGTAMPVKDAPSGATVPVEPEPQLRIEPSEPELQRSEPEPQFLFNRNGYAGSTGTTVPTTEQEQNRRQNSITEQLDSADVDISFDDSEEGAGAYSNFVSEIFSKGQKSEQRPMAELAARHSGLISTPGGQRGKGDPRGRAAGHVWPPSVFVQGGDDPANPARAGCEVEERGVRELRRRLAVRITGLLHQGRPDSPAQPALRHRRD
jgi:hypothetical protein